MGEASASNFGHLKAHDEQLVRLGLLAERYFPEDPNTCLLKLRQLTEALAQLAASRVGIYAGPEEKQTELLRRLQDHGILPREVSALFHEVRKAGNDANHKLAGDHRVALLALRLTWQLSVWFHRTFKDPAFKSGPFLPPSAPTDEGAELKAELESLRAELAAFRVAHQDAAQALQATQAQVQQTERDRAFWESMAAEADAAKAELAAKLQAVQAQSATQSPLAVTQLIDAANSAAATLQLSEADTRKLIDEQLTLSGWAADTAAQTYAKGARPQKGKHLAIAEWPTQSGPADYVLFAGLTPIAVVEAKRKNIDVSGALQQAKRYSRDFTCHADLEMPFVSGSGGEAFKVPFAFSSNGRPFLRQLATKSGVWFCDLRRPDNLSQPLAGWYTPEGLTALLKRDEARAHEKLANEPFNYGFALRHYQQAAIKAAEAAIQTGQRELLLAMATVLENDDLGVRFAVGKPGEQFSPIDQLSAGQRCTAIFPILLKLKDGPLVVDQPEDNLDNRHIAKSVSPVLVGDKRVRQIILTSHNANLVVLSDPENIAVFEAVDGKGVLSVAGFLSHRYSAVTQPVLDILDGGQRALDLRARKYGHGSQQ
ncbi:MAG: hypothetical protein KF788_06295 [Piscinibacter sp.]|nr:hypothetical protein [Piscinibacter sp.]